MKLIQTRVSEAELRQIRRFARAEGKTQQEWIRAAIHDKLRSRAVDPKDPIFQAFPLVKPRKGAKSNVAEHHDELLYGFRP